MTYKLITSEDFENQFKKLDNSVQVLVFKWINKHLIDIDDPKTYGKALSANLKGYWRYKIGDYRLLVEIRDKELCIIAVGIGHRKDIYK